MTPGERGGTSPDVVIIGCGPMGGALAAGYRARVPEGRLLVVDRNVDRVRASLPPGQRIRIVATIAEIGQVRPGMTVLATKPQGMAAAFPLLAPLPATRELVVSIAAVEALAQAGAEAGLEAPLADELARATVMGAAAMLERSSSGPAALKAAVRSPGGTTDAALRVFEDGNALALLFGRAVAAAHARARKLRQPMDAATGRQAGGPARKPAPAHDEGKAPHG